MVLTNFYLDFEWQRCGKAIHVDLIRAYPFGLEEDLVLFLV